MPTLPSVSHSYTSKCHTVKKRLLSNHFQAQVVLLYYSFFSTCIAIYYLKFDNANDLANVSWLSFSILTMIASIFISTLRYKERADSVKQCYESLTSIYSRIHQETSLSELYAIEDKYNYTCSLCENHSSSDYSAAIISEYSKNDKNGRQRLSKKPTCHLRIESNLNKIKRVRGSRTCSTVARSCLSLERYFPSST